MTDCAPIIDADPPDSDESWLWDEVTKGVKPLKGRKKQASTAPQPASKPPNKQKAATPAPAKQAAQTIPGQGIDKRTDERLRRGQMAIEARLDLHGLRLHEAQDALKRFILDCHARQLRCLLVITGKGRSGQIGVIRENLPQWLCDPALQPMILQSYKAQPKDGGGGAVYILLRRRR